MSMFSMSSSRAALGSGGGLFEVVEVHDDHVDGVDCVFGERLHVGGVGAHGEDGAGDVGVHGLDAAVEHFGEAGDVGGVGDGDAVSRRSLAVPPVEMSSMPRVEGEGEFGDVGFFGDADEGAADLGHVIKGSLRVVRVWLG